jgi:hypothetical protein
MSPEQRQLLIERYAAGPSLLRAALSGVPPEAMKWRPGPGKWSAHEVVAHCADSETVSSTRIRLLVGEDDPTLVGYDQDRWARTFDYHAIPLDLCLMQVESVRAWTTHLIRRLPEEAWARAGTHTESGRYTAETWLGLYAEHLEIHARQIDRNVAAFRAAAGG